VKPKLGPKGLILLRHMVEVGPVTPREGGALLHPDAKGEGRAHGTGRGHTDARGMANRAAGTLLGHMARAGWVVAGTGERFHVPYSITDAGREAMRATTERLEADPIVSVHDQLPEGRKRCVRCSRARPLASFFRDSHNKRDGLGNRCRFCGNEEQAERRGALIALRDADAEWTRASKEVIVMRTMALLRAVREARRVGMWRGRHGLKAYTVLGDALDLFTGNGAKDPQLIAAEVIDPDDNHPPDTCDPRDADWNPRVHTNEGWYGRAL